MMKSYFILFIVFMISFHTYQSYAQENVAGETLWPFFNALKTGDTTKLLQYIDGPLQNRNKVLLQQNKNYSDLLKTKYEKAEFTINKISPIDNEKLVADILIVTPRGNTIKRKLILNKKEGSNSWKIVDEIRSGM